MGKKNSGNHSLNEGRDTRQTRVAWQTLVWVKEAFGRAASDAADALNRGFKVWQQLTAAMWLWVFVIPPELKLHALEWALGLTPYDPIVGERIREALSRALRPQEPPPDEHPDNQHTGK